MENARKSETSAGQQPLVLNAGWLPGLNTNRRRPLLSSAEQFQLQQNALTFTQDSVKPGVDLDVRILCLDCSTVAKVIDSLLFWAPSGVL